MTYRLAFAVAVIVALFASPISAWHHGLDIYDAFKDVACLKRQNISLLIIRCYQSLGRADPNCKHNLQAAKTAGVPADLYVFPCVKCGNPEKQVADTIKNAQGEKYGTIWIDLEIFAWYKEKAKNKEFALAMVKAVEKAGKKVGIYTSAHNWGEIFGMDWTALAKYPLWYAHYDKDPSFKDFKAFGGWTKPMIKQYTGEDNVCGEDVDNDYFP